MDHITVLTGSINVAARFDERIYYACGCPIINLEGIDWYEMTDDQKLDLCLMYLRETDQDFDALIASGHDVSEFILFTKNTAASLMEVVLNKNGPNIEDYVFVQDLNDMRVAATFMLAQDAKLWDFYFK